RLTAPATSGSTKAVTPSPMNDAQLGPVFPLDSVGLRTTSISPCPPSRSRWSHALASWRGTTNAAVTVSTARALALNSLKVPSSRSATVMGWSGSGPVRALPALGPDGGGGGHPEYQPGGPAGGGHAG